MLKKRYAVAVATAALTLMLAGCTGGSSGTDATGPTKGGTENSAPAQADQSKADACKIIQDSLTEFSQATSEMDPTKPQEVLDKFKELSASSVDALNSITNEEVKAGAGKAATALEGYIEFLDVAMTDPSKIGEMSDQVADLQAAFTEVGTVCAS